MMQRSGVSHALVGKGAADKRHDDHDRLRDRGTATSGTRLPARGPWLCGPGSPLVCGFGQADSSIRFGLRLSGISPIFPAFDLQAPASCNREPVAYTASELLAITPAMTAQPSTDAARTSTRDLVLYFLKLGTIGFGGPAALVGYMRRDLVEDRKSIDEATYNLALALAQIMPGPLAAQTAMAIGYFQGGVVGATLVGLVFVLPSFLMVLGLSALYV